MISESDKAKAFDRLLQHLREQHQVQNIELMNLADFCRNCLSQWLQEANNAAGGDVSKAQAREYVYAMPYEQWQANYQKPATAEQLAQFERRQKRD